MIRDNYKQLPVIKSVGTQKVCYNFYFKNIMLFFCGNHHCQQYDRFNAFYAIDLSKYPQKIEKSKFFDVFKGLYNQISAMKWVRLTKTCLGKSEKATVSKHFQWTSCLNVFDHFMGLVLEGLSVISSIYISCHHDPWCRAAIGWDDTHAFKPSRQWHVQS